MAQHDKYRCECVFREGPYESIVVVYWSRFCQSPHDDLRARVLAQQSSGGGA